MPSVLLNFFFFLQKLVLLPLSLPCGRYLLSDLYVYPHNVRPSLRFSNRFPVCFLLNHPPLVRGSNRQFRTAELPRLWLAVSSRSASWRRFRGRMNTGSTKEVILDNWLPLCRRNFEINFPQWNGYNSIKIPLLIDCNDLIDKRWYWFSQCKFFGDNPMFRKFTKAIYTASLSHND